MTSDSEFMGEALRLARENVESGRGGPFAAVIVREGKVIGQGVNLVTSTNDPTAHGEVVAIRDACHQLATFSLEGATIYSSCEPCPMCLAAIYWARIDRIYFANDRFDAARIGFDDELLYREIVLPHDQRTKPTQGLPSDEARTIFDLWMAKTDKIKY